MTRARSVAIALTAAALCAPAAALGQDPESPAATPAQASEPGLTQEPDLGTGTAGTGGSSSTDTDPANTDTGTIGSAGALPNTGSDPRLAVLAGLALLLSGLGLRLRTADEVF